jgi:hypothetical protein
MFSNRNSKAKPWLLYGSRKNEYTGVYRVSKAFDYTTTEISLEEAFDGYKIYSHREEEIKMEPKENRDGFETIEYFYPKILAILFFNCGTSIGFSI